MRKKHLKLLVQLFIASFLFVACSKNDETQEENLILEIGQEYQGGVIFYIDESAQHGLIAATQDIGIAPWGCFYNDGSVPNFEPPTIPIAQNDGIGFGQQNTSAILNFCGDPNIAARLADNLVVNGFDDWYLPSIDELALVYENRDLIGGFPDLNNTAPGEGLVVYSSSSEGWRTDDGNGGDYYLNYQVYEFTDVTAFPDVRILFTSKGSDAPVRPIRSF